MSLSLFQLSVPIRPRIRQAYNPTVIHSEPCQPCSLCSSILRRTRKQGAYPARSKHLTSLFSHSTQATLPRIGYNTVWNARPSYRCEVRQPNLHGFPQCIMLPYNKLCASHLPAMPLLSPSVEWRCSQHQCRRVASPAHLLNRFLCHFAATARGTKSYSVRTRSSAMLKCDPVCTKLQRQSTTNLFILQYSVHLWCKFIRL